MGEEDNGNQITDKRMRVSLDRYFTMGFGWMRGRGEIKITRDTEITQRRGRGKKDSA